MLPEVHPNALTLEWHQRTGGVDRLTPNRMPRPPDVSRETLEQGMFPGRSDRSRILIRSAPNLLEDLKG